MLADLELSELDPGVRQYVATLREAGIETFESCQGGDGHCGPECFVKVNSYDLMAAVTVARNHDLPLVEIRDMWHLDKGHRPIGPIGVLVFAKSVTK